MRIGIDMDDTITNSTQTIRDYILKYDYKYCSDNYMKDNIDIILRGFFENNGVKEFFRDNAREMASKMSVKDNVKEVIDKLRNEGKKIVIITARSDDYYIDAKKFCEDFLNNHNIYYDEVIIDQLYKVDACKNNNIDLMIDDGVDTCDSINNQGMKALLFNSELNINKESISPRVSSWNEVYEFIQNM